MNDTNTTQRCATCGEQFDEYNVHKSSSAVVDETDEWFCPNGHRAYIHYAGGYEVQRAGIAR